MDIYDIRAFDACGHKTQVNKIAVLLDLHKKRPGPQPRTLYLQIRTWATAQDVFPFKVAG